MTVYGTIKYVLILLENKSKAIHENTRTFRPLCFKLDAYWEEKTNMNSLKPHIGSVSQPHTRYEGVKDGYNQEMIFQRRRDLPGTRHLPVPITL